MTHPDGAELHLERTVTPAGRIIGVGAGVIVVGSGVAIGIPELAVLAIPLVLGALTQRASRTWVERGPPARTTP